MESNNMNTAKLEVKHKDCIMDIAPDWFIISDIVDGVKYMCETKDAYPKNMIDNIWSSEYNTFIDNPDCYLCLINFNNLDVTEYFECLIAAYVNDYIEEFIKEHDKCLSDLNIVVKYSNAI